MLLPKHMILWPHPFLCATVFLQDVNMRKAFRGSTVQDQQVVSRSSILDPSLEMYQRSDKPPPLHILTTYRSVWPAHSRLAPPTVIGD